MGLILTAAKLLTPDREIDRPAVTIEDGRIGEIRSRGASEAPSGAEHLDFPNATLAPAYFDVHTHGAMGFDVMEGSDAAFDAIGTFLATRGVCAYLPTTVTAPVDRTLRSLEGIAHQIERAKSGLNSGGPSKGAVPVGIHLEGPFLSHAKRGIHPTEDLQIPSAPLLRRFHEAASGKISLMTVAPELPQAAEMIHEAVNLGIRVSLGHSNANTADARAGIAAGARSATHTFNAMRPLDHREPGLLGVVLDDRELFAELICDGVHVDPVLVRLFYRAKGLEKGILVTDAMAATGMPDGMYKLGSLDVTVAGGKCMYEGKLAGSVLTLDRAVRNFVEFTAAPRQTAVRYASTNPARMLGLDTQYGELAPRRFANVVVLTNVGAVAQVILNGRPFTAPD